MARLLGMLFVPFMAVVGLLFLLLGLCDASSRLLAIAGSVLLGSVLISLSITNNVRR